MKSYEYFMGIAVEEAKKSLNEGGIPIGAVLVKDNKVISKGHNRLIQDSSVILHAEMDAIENAGRLNYEDYQKTTLFTTLSPCPMCSGAVILYNIPKVVVGDNTSLMGAENLLKDNNVEVIVLNDKRCRKLFEIYLEEYPDVWADELAKVGNTTELI
ncbi:MAG: nucleoside deaminase [Methanobrevibacter sp.]|uniref:nucleoside deaminase n=1 Tax=Methanobrevibacter sp. TaxID=66852 RepID=UPI0026DF6FAB|nr:nucleoside deaminase [Methanobrevibacter sp.]MDO5848590.1 nucleoside deaminase [Methanobrevibacter sp.]